MKVISINLSEELDAFLKECKGIGMFPSVCELIRHCLYAQLPELMKNYAMMYNLSHEDRCDNVLDSMRELGYVIKMKHVGKSRVCKEMGNPFWKRVHKANGVIEYEKIPEMWAEE